MLKKCSFPDPRAGEYTLGHIAENQVKAHLTTNLAKNKRKINIRTVGKGEIFHHPWDISGTETLRHLRDISETTEPLGAVSIQRVSQGPVLGQQIRADPSWTWENSMGGQKLGDDRVSLQQTSGNSNILFWNLSGIYPIYLWGFVVDLKLPS